MLNHHAMLKRCAPIQMVPKILIVVLLPWPFTRKLRTFERLRLDVIQSMRTEKAKYTFFCNVWATRVFA